LCVFLAVAVFVLSSRKKVMMGKRKVGLSYDVQERDFLSVLLPDFSGFPLCNGGARHHDTALLDQVSASGGLRHYSRVTIIQP
jgi:hypothetical protein